MSKIIQFSKIRNKSASGIVKKLPCSAISRWQVCSPAGAGPAAFSDLGFKSPGVRASLLRFLLSFGFSLRRRSGRKRFKGGL